jgi:hypothetical protein
MDTTSCISTRTTLIRQFFLVFTAPGAEIFLALVFGWVLCTGRHTITGILAFADPMDRHAHDAFHRFLPDARWEMDGLWRLLPLLLVKTFASSGVIELDLDDTLFHRCGRKVSGAIWWRDAVRSTRTRTVYAWGLDRWCYRCGCIHRRAANRSPTTSITVTVMRSSVSIPVLSEQMTSTEPSVSMPGRLRTRALRRSIRWALLPSVQGSRSVSQFGRRRLLEAAEPTRFPTS